jgi:hypothetical protein
MEITGISPQPFGPEFIKEQKPQNNRESKVVWDQHLAELGLDNEQTALYQGLLQGLSEGSLTAAQSESLENLLKKLFNLKNVYLQNG